MLRVVANYTIFDLALHAEKRVAYIMPIQTGKR